MDQASPTDLRIVLGEIPELNVRTVKLIGRVPYDPDNANAWRLGERLRREGRRGVIMDYSECVLDHTLAEYGKTASVLAQSFPPGVRIAYIFAPANFVHAAFLTKQLAKAGFPAAAVATHEQAVVFLSGD